MNPATQLVLLVLRAQEGDREALDRLLRTVERPLFGYIRGLVGDHALAEDVLQDVLFLICRRLRHLREPMVFRSWAYRIASRRAFRVLAKERRDAGRPLAELPDEPVSPAPSPALEKASELRPLLRALSPASRAVVGLHYFEGLSLREAADVLEIPVGTAKSRLNYGLEALRRLAAAGDGHAHDGSKANEKPGPPSPADGNHGRSK